LIAAFEKIGSADHFQNQDRDHQSEGKENAQPSFKGVFHSVLVCQFEVRILKTLDERVGMTFYFFNRPMAMSWPSDIIARRSATPKRVPVVADNDWK